MSIPDELKAVNMIAVNLFPYDDDAVKEVAYSSMDICTATRFYAYDTAYNETLSSTGDGVLEVLYLHTGELGLL